MQREVEIQKAVAEEILRRSNVSSDKAAEIEKLKMELAEAKILKDAERAAMRESIRLELQKNQETSLQRYKEDNENLRLRIREMEAAKSSDSQTTAENAAMKKELDLVKRELEDLKRAGSSSGRLRQSVIPSDKMIASMTPQARRELKRKLERFEKEDK